MYSLIITVESITAVAHLACDSALSAIKAYLQHTADSQVHDADYSIPSLIWPPPSCNRLLQAILHVPTPPHFPPISPPRCFWQLCGDSLCVSR